MWNSNESEEAARTGGGPSPPESTGAAALDATPPTASENTSSPVVVGPSSSDVASAAGSSTTSSARGSGQSSTSLDGSNDREKVWSPSQTSDWSRCPVMWDLSRRWERFGGNSWSPERVTGDAIHAGIARMMRLIQHRTGSDEDVLAQGQQTGLDFLKSEWPTDAPMEYSVEGVEGVVKKTIKELLKLAPEFLTGRKIIGVEHNFGESIVDLVTMDEEHGWLEVTDWKYSASVQPQYIASRLDDTETTHQFFHYAWRASQVWGRPTKLIRKVLLVGAPKTTVKQREVEVTPERLATWEKSADQMWKLMSLMRAGEVTIHERLEGCRMYGGCSFYDGCHRLGRDETKFGTIYKEKVWTPRRTR